MSFSTRGGPHLFAHLPHAGAVDLAHGEAFETLAGHDDASDLIAAGHLIIDLQQHLKGRGVAQGINPLENFPALGIEFFIHRQDAVMGDGLADGAGDALHRVAEGLFLRHFVHGDEAAVEEFHDAVHRAEQDAAFAEDIAAVLMVKGGLEDKGSAHGHGPAQGKIGGLAVDVLLHRETAVDARAVDGLALLIEPAHRRTHALGADADDVDVLGEGLADAFEITQQKAMGQAQGGAVLHVGKYLLKVLRLGRVGDQQHDQIGFPDHLIHLAQGAVFPGETGGRGCLHGGAALAQADFDLDVGACQRVAEVLGLGRTLGAPADDADLSDAVQGLGQQREKVAAALDNGLFGIGQFDGLRLEDI